MLNKLCRIACSRHGCIFLSPVFDRYTSQQYRCARAQLSKFPSWPQFWIQKCQNIFKTAWNPAEQLSRWKFSQLLTSSHTFFLWSWIMRILPAETFIIKIINKLRILLCWTQPSEALGFFESVDKISDYSGQICTKNRELIVKNRLISYLQKIRFPSIIKKNYSSDTKIYGRKNMRNDI